MSRLSHFVRGAAVAALVGAAASCAGPDHNLVTLPTVGGGLFTSYVALGNSLTAGYQSGGINDSTQRQSFAVLLAHQMGTRFAYPSLVNPGCPPPLTNFATGARVTPKGYPASTDATCFLRDPASATDVLNNVAVPGANSADPTGGPGSAANALTTFVLGGLTQAQRALVAKPTFATIWIGNNDILAYALNGTPQFATPQATFVSNYNAMMTQLMAGAPTLKGVLMGVVQVALAPQLFPAAALANPQFVAGLSVAVGKQVLVHPDCLAGPGAQSLINIQIVSALRTAPVPMIVCAKGDVPGAGDVGILDVDEQAFVQNTVNGYNAYIKAKADSLGWAYWDPNTVLTQLKATGAVSTVPNLASSTAPFGTAISLDGVHPSASGHIAIANALIQTINAKFNTSIPAISQ